jgi:UDP-N-acetyl-D-glucosamine dehydrogenase
MSKETRYDIAVIGAGYVGMPHAQTFAEAGKKVVLVDVQQSVVDGVNRGESHIADVPSEQLKPHVESGAISATTDFAVVGESDAVVIAVPTPLSTQREPDLSYVEQAARSIAPHLRAGHLVVLESTTYPGTTREVLRPLLEAGSGLTAGDEFHLAFAPERVDPGRTDFTTKTTPKVVGGIDESSTEAAAELYRGVVADVHQVSTAEAAELSKLL